MRIEPSDFGDRDPLLVLTTDYDRPALEVVGAGESLRWLPPRRIISACTRLRERFVPSGLLGEVLRRVGARLGQCGPVSWANHRLTTTVTKLLLRWVRAAAARAVYRARKRRGAFATEAGIGDICEVAG
jgi:hypothetical protein